MFLFLLYNDYNERIIITIVCVFEKQLSSRLGLFLVTNDFL